MRMIDADEVIKFYANFINEHGFDPKDARFSIRDIEMNLWNIPTVEPTVNKWIPCSERLPEETSLYLVSGKWESGRKAVDTAEFDVDDGYFDCSWNFTVQAWMELPKAYEVKNDSD